MLVLSIAASVVGIVFNEEKMLEMGSFTYMLLSRIQHLIDKEGQSVKLFCETYGYEQSL